MNPFRIIIAFFILNVAAICLVIRLLSPKSYANFGLQESAIQQVDVRDSEAVSGRPTHLTIPSVHVDIAVASGNYNSDTKTWDVSNDKAQFASITPEANNKVGSTFIYGLNIDQVFSPLDGLVLGEKALIQTDSGHLFTYTLSSIENVSPTDTSAFEYRGPSVLTLQSNSANWYEERRLFIFNFAEVN